MIKILKETGLKFIIQDDRGSAKKYILIFSKLNKKIDLITLYNQSTILQIIVKANQKQIKKFYQIQNLNWLLQFQQKFTEFYQMNSLFLEPNLDFESLSKDQHSKQGINVQIDDVSNKGQYNQNLSPEENSLELMIRAHQRIRTLQEDNQILRMHIDLLSKDNKELNRKLQMASIQKNESIKLNQQMQKSLQQLQIKLQGFKVKEQLYTLQNHTFCKRAIYDNYEQGSNFKVSNSKFQSVAARKDAELQQQNKISKEPTQSGEIKKLENYDRINESALEKCFETQKNNQTQKNFSYYMNKPNMPFQQLNKRNKSEERHQKVHFTPNKSFDIQKCQNKFSRNLSHKQLPNYQYTNKSLDFSNDRSLPRESPNFTNLHDNYLNKNIQTAASDFYVNKNTELRPNSPLIRKNSPNKNRNNICQFHPHKRAPSSHGSAYTNQQNLSKKFNYTNWRKTNNNLLVWRLATGSGHTKPIFIDR